MADLVRAQTVGDSPAPALTPSARRSRREIAVFVGVAGLSRRLSRSSTRRSACG